MYLIHYLDLIRLADWRTARRLLQGRAAPRDAGLFGYAQQHRARLRRHDSMQPDDESRAYVRRPLRHVATENRRHARRRDREDGRESKLSRGRARYARDRDRRLEWLACDRAAAARGFSKRSKGRCRTCKAIHCRARIQKLEPLVSKTRSARWPWSRRATNRASAAPPRFHRTSPLGFSRSAMPSSIDTFGRHPRICFPPECDPRACRAYRRARPSW